MNQDHLLQALEFLGKFHGNSVNAAGVVQGLPTEGGRLTPELFERAAERCGFTSQIIHRSLSHLHQATLPAVLLMEHDDSIVLLKIKKGKGEEKVAEVSVTSAGGGIQEIALGELEEKYTGYSILVKPNYQFEARAEFTPELSKRNWFWGTLWRFRHFYARVGFATIMINLLALSSSLFIMNVYDRVVPNQAIETLWALAIGVFIAFGLEFVLKLLRTFFIDRAGQRIDLILGGALFAKVLGIEYSQKPASSGALAGQARSYEGLREFFTSATISALFDLPFVFLFAVIIYLLGGIVALPLVIGAILALCIGAMLQFPISRAVSSSYKAGNQRQALYVEGVHALETVKTTCSESELQARMEENVHIAAKADGKARRYSQLALNTATLIQQIVVVSIVIISVFQVQKELMTMGAMIACVILAGRAMAPLAMVSSLLTRLQQSRRSLQGLDQIMQTSSEREEHGAKYITLTDFKPEIRVQDVCFSYGEEAGTILKDVNISIKEGERVGILGAVGSGKSTFLRLLINLYYPESGRIDISGVDSRQIEPADLRRRIGYVQQEPTPLFGTLRSNLRAGCPWATDESIWNAVERAGLANYIRSLPRGLDHSVAEGGKSLSGGQRQAISVARALLEEPSLLIFDEPTSSMDWASEKRFLEQLDDYLKKEAKRTLIIATHKRSVLSVVDRIVVIDNGKIVADGPKDLVLKKKEGDPPNKSDGESPSLSVVEAG